MKLASFLHPNLIKIKHKVDSSENVIKDLVKEICKGLSPKLEDKIIKAVMERERLGSTVERGISIPHARIEGFKDLVIAISIPEKPVLVNGEEVKIFFLILSSKTSSKLYLNTLSAIARLALDSELMEKVFLCKKPEDVISTIEKADIRVKEELTVRDIMEEEFPVISPEATLKQAIDFLYREDILFALVVEKGNLVGEITLLEVIKKGTPHYAMNLANLGFLRTLEPLENVLQNEEKIRVREVMSPVTVSLAPDSSVVEAVVKMAKERRFFIPVMEKEKAVGVVTLKNSVIRVLRA